MVAFGQTSSSISESEFWFDTLSELSFPLGFYCRKFDVNGHIPSFEAGNESREIENRSSNEEQIVRTGCLPTWSYFSSMKCNP